jgi:hypothetical protein
MMNEALRQLPRDVAPLRRGRKFVPAFLICFIADAILKRSPLLWVNTSLAHVTDEPCQSDHHMMCP